MSRILASVLILGFSFIPSLTFGAGMVPCGGAGEVPCQACHVVQLVNGGIEWLVLMLGTIAAIIIVYAGFKLVMSGGNRHAMEEAKKLINNMLIGYVIVLAGWLLIDTGMKLLLDDGQTALGMWNQVQCTAQPTLSGDPWENQDPEYEPDGDFTESRCAAGPSGGYTQCQAQQAQCTSAGGQPTVVEISNNEYQVRCLMPTLPVGGGSGSGGSGGGSGSCAVETNPNNACHPSKLTCFPDRNLASKVCNLESRGGNTGIMSGTDLCRDRKSFSVGLWQINILANRHLIPGCTGTFFTSDNGGRSEGSCIQETTNSRGVRYCQFRSCRITNNTMYNYCVSQAKVPANNTRAACSLIASQGWGAWQTSYNACR